MKGATDQVGPDEEQLGFAEDLHRLCEIGDLLLAGHARLDEFSLTKWELVILDGYINGVAE